MTITLYRIKIVVAAALISALVTLISDRRKKGGEWGESVSLSLLAFVWFLIMGLGVVIVLGEIE